MAKWNNKTKKIMGNTYNQEAQQAKDDLNNSLKVINEAGLGLSGTDATNKDKIIDKIKELKQQAAQAVNNLLNDPCRG